MVKRMGTQTEEYFFITCALDMIKYKMPEKGNKPVSQFGKNTWECTRYPGKYEDRFYPNEAIPIDSDEQPFDFMDVYDEDGQLPLSNDPAKVDRKNTVTTAAKIKLWEAESEWREPYLVLKDSQSFDFETGFNVCKDTICFDVDPLQEGGTRSDTFVFTDWQGKGLP